MISGVLKLGTMELPWLECDVQHSNSLVSHEHPGVPGGVQESTGRDPYQIRATVVLIDNWSVTLDALLYAADVEQEGDLTIADGRMIHIAIRSVTERWRQTDGLHVAIEMVEDAQADAYLVPTAPQLARTAPEIARARGWSRAAALLGEFRDLIDAASPPTLGELVAAYGAVSVALVSVEETAYDIADRGATEDAMWSVTLRWGCLGSLPAAAREALDAAG